MKFKGEITTALLSLVFIIGFYSDNVFHPNRYLFSTEGDGMKNYYVYLSHITKDSTYNQFEGLNYPYGEIVIYLDGNPAIANALKFLSNFSPIFETHAIGILNGLMLFSLLITALVLYKIFQWYKIDFISASFFALAVTMLAPQIYRMLGHYSMCFSFVVPLVYWLLLKKHDSSFSRKYDLALLFIIFTLFFIHPYLSIISTAFIVVYDLMRWWVNKGNAKGRLLSLFLSALLPLILFQLYTFIFDGHENRPATPGGFYDITAKINSVFVAHDEYMAHVFKEVFNIAEQPWESWCYIGLFSILILFFSLQFGFFKMLQNKVVKLREVFSKEENILLFAGFLVLLYSFAFPFTIGFDFILDWIQPIKQIRALARFTWVFYFAVNIFSFVTVYKWISSTGLVKRKVLYITVFVFISLINMSESWIYHWRAAQDINKQMNLFIDPKKDAELVNLIKKAGNPEKYQAMIALPFYHEGAEEYGINFPTHDKKYSMLLAYHLKLPMVNSALSRTSTVESKNIIQSIGLPYLDKPIAKDIPSKKPLLIIRVKVEVSTEENMLLSRATKIGETDKYELYEVTVDQWLANTSAQEIKDFLAQKDSLIRLGSFYVHNAGDLFFFNDFEQDKFSTDLAFHGKRTFKGKKNDYNVFYRGSESGDVVKDQEYTISYWYSTAQENALVNMGIFEEVDKTTGASEWSTYDTRHSFNTYKDWQLVSQDYKLKNPNASLNVLTKTYSSEDPYFYVDAFMIQKKNTVVYRVKEGVLYKNNFPLGKISLPNMDKGFVVKAYQNSFAGQMGNGVDTGSVLLSAENPYGPGLQQTWKDAFWKNSGRKLTVKAKVKSLEEGLHAALVFDVSSGDKSKIYIGEDYKELPVKEWVELTKEYDIPIGLEEGDIVKIYIYTANGKKFLLSQFDVNVGWNE